MGLYLAPNVSSDFGTWWVVNRKFCNFRNFREIGAFNFTLSRNWKSARFLKPLNQRHHVALLYVPRYKNAHTVYVQSTFLVGEQICRQFAVSPCVLSKIVINIFFRMISYLSTIQISASYHENCSNATTEYNTSQISPACKTCIKPILLIWPYSIFFEIVEQLCRRLAAFTCVLPKNVNNIFFAPVSKEFAQEKSAF